MASASIDGRVVQSIKANGRGIRLMDMECSGMQRDTFILVNLKIINPMALSFISNKMDQDMKASGRMEFK